MDPFAVPATFPNPCPGHTTGPPALLFAKLVQTVLASQCGFNNPKDYPRDRWEDIGQEEFDFIVVGAGSAGSVVASRLSENPAWKVLLIEAGTDPDLVSDVPAFLFSTQGSRLDWGYSSEPSPLSCLSIEGGGCPVPRGRVLGGSSSINAMLYVRGNPEDFDEWERLGNPGWGYQEVLERFKRSEQLVGFYALEDVDYDALRGVRRGLQGRWEAVWELSKKVAKNYHGLHGPLTVGHYGHDYKLAILKNLMFDAAEEVGVPYVGDINGKRQIGFTQAMGTLYHGTRANVAKMFLVPVRDRQNLWVVKGGLVERVLVEEGRAVGVVVSREGQTREVRAKKEVILSAGSINSPQLLMLSGIGPASHLASLNIPLVKDLQGVGQNLQDHLIILAPLSAINRANPQGVTPLQQLDALYEFLTRGTGLFSTIGVTDVIGFLNTLNLQDPVPDIQMFNLHIPLNDTYLIHEVLRVLKFLPEVRAQYLDVITRAEMLITAPALLRPKSVGHIELRSANPTDPPKIHHNFLAEQDDIDTLLRGVKFAQKLHKTQTLAPLTPEEVLIKIPACEGRLGDDYWTCLIRHLAVPVYHPVGTCKMGPSSDAAAVVDARLRVHGVAGLRVADASIMPNIVRGNTNAASIMIGEMVSDFIKQNEEQGENKTEHNEL